MVQPKPGTLVNSIQDVGSVNKRSHSMLSPSKNSAYRSPLAKKKRCRRTGTEGSYAERCIESTSLLSSVHTYSANNSPIVKLDDFVQQTSLSELIKNSCEY